MQEVPPREPSEEATPPPKGRLFFQNTACPNGHHDGNNESPTKGRSRGTKTLPRVTLICATLCSICAMLFFLQSISTALKQRRDLSRDPKGAQRGSSRKTRADLWCGARPDAAALGPGQVGRSPKITPCWSRHQGVFVHGKQSWVAGEEWDKIQPEGGHTQRKPTQSWRPQCRWMLPGPSWRPRCHWTLLDLSLGACANNRGGLCPQRTWGSCKNPQSCPRG